MEEIQRVAPPIAISWSRKGQPHVHTCSKDRAGICMLEAYPIVLYLTLTTMVRHQSHSAARPHSTKGCKSRLVLCPCCERLVCSQTRTNHKKLQTGAPHIKAAALTYRRRVGLEDLEPEEEQLPLFDSAEQDEPEILEHLEDIPVAGPSCYTEPETDTLSQTISGQPSLNKDPHDDVVSNTLHNLYSTYRKATVEDESEDEEAADEDSDSADVHGGLGGSVENNEESDSEAEEVDEDGLRAYERLSERFEQELEEIGAHMSEDRVEILIY